MIEKIKLEWETVNSPGSCRSDFVLNGEKYSFYSFALYSRVGLRDKDGHYPLHSDFPKDKTIQNVEEGKEFCQQWLDDYIDKLNKKTEVQDRVLSVLQDIWSGNTELSWQKIVLFEKEREFSQGFFCDGILYFHVEEDVASYLKPTTSRGISALDDYVMSFGLGDSSYFDSERRKRDFQDIYNKALLYVAAKGLA